MAVHFHKLKIRQIKKETPDCVSINFEVPAELGEYFAFREGQNITIRQVLNGEELRRSYSICAAPHEKELKVAVKAMEGGIFSNYANTGLKAGDELDVMPPTGNFFARITENATHNLAIAAGSGITPVISIIKHTLAVVPGSTFTLIYGNRNRNSIIFFEELEGLKNKYLDRFNLINILSREITDAPIHHGRIDEQKLASLGTLIDYKKMDNIYICGPEALIFGSSAYLQQLGIPKSKIHFELFTVPGEIKKQKPGTVQDAKTDGKVSKILIKLDGRTFDFALAQNGESILDAALQQGADLPYACKGGVCCSCRAKVIEGKVDMDVNYALEEDEVEAGYVLTCQSHPRSEKVLIDFDAR